MSQMMYTSAGVIDKQQHLAEFAPLVKRIAHHMMSRLPGSVEADDLIQVGMMGLMDALNRYQEIPGAQFATYAQQRIRGAMLDELRQMDWLPRGRAGICVKSKQQSTHCSNASAVRPRNRK